jgi:hypothetical protein
MKNSDIINYMKNISLATPLHDPNSLIIPILLKNGEKLMELYEGKIGINVTQNTSKKTLNVFNDLGIETNIIEASAGLGDDYRKAIKAALKYNTPVIQLLDFDRALHWIERFPEELSKVLEEIVSKKGFTSFVRSRRAFETHPITQRSTETAVNAIASEVAGMGVDIMSGSFAMERKLAEQILEESKRNDFGFYAEPLMIGKKNGFLIQTVEVDGLEWETPDQYKDQIEKYGYSGWLDRFESLNEWEKRVKLLDEASDELTSS